LVRKLLRNNNPTHNNTYLNSDDYILYFPDARTVSRTNRKKFLNRFNEHVPTFSHHSHSPKFSQDLLETQNPTSTSDDIIDVLYTRKKGLHLSTFEKFTFM
jgi:hypothetical protein